MDDFVFQLGDYVWYRGVPISSIEVIYKVIRVPRFTDSYDLEDSKGKVSSVDVRWFHSTDKASMMEVLLYF